MLVFQDWNSQNACQHSKQGRPDQKEKDQSQGAQWLSGRVLDLRPMGRGFEPHRHHCVVSLSKNINPSLVLVQPRKTRPYITERLLMGCKESNQTKKDQSENNIKTHDYLHTMIKASAKFLNN